jgi:uncharacterized transporter YbjL
MGKFILLSLLVLAFFVVIYLTFIIAKIKIIFGSILLGISAILFFVVWLMWKSRDKS